MTRKVYVTIKQQFSNAKTFWIHFDSKLILLVIILNKFCYKLKDSLTLKSSYYVRFYHVVSQFIFSALIFSLKKNFVNIFLLTFQWSFINDVTNFLFSKKLQAALLFAGLLFVASTIRRFFLYVPNLVFARFLMIIRRFLPILSKK